MQVCVCVWWCVCGGAQRLVVLSSVIYCYLISCDRVCLSLNPELIHLAMLDDQ